MYRLDEDDDTDGDGVPDHLDNDDDGNGIPDDGGFLVPFFSL